MAATTTYVQLVNSSILESGSESATFDPSGSDFSTRTDKYMNLFKTWVPRAWKEIQMNCYGWEFLQEQGLCNLDPGIMFYTDGTPISTFSTGLTNSTFNIYDQDGTVAIPSVTAGTFTDLTGLATMTLPFGYFNFSGLTATNPLNIALKPGAEYFSVTTTNYTSSTGVLNFGSVASYDPVGDIFISRTTGETSLFGAASITSITGSSPTLSIAFTSTNPLVLAALTDPTVTSMLLLTYVSGISQASVKITSNFPAGITASTQSINKAFVHSWKSYNFNEETQAGDFQENIQEIDEKSFRIIDYMHPPSSGEIPVPFMAWSTFRSSYDISSAFPGMPRLVSEDDTGRYRLYPSPYYTISMKFDYSRLPQILVNYGDIPRGIDDDFMDIIMWKAITYYGEYMEQPSIVARSEKNYKNLLSRLEQKNREKFYFKPKKLW